MTDGKWFNKYGEEVNVTNKNIIVGKAGSGHYFEEYSCTRCGGAGGSEHWKHTGVVCFRCGASTRRLQGGRYSDPASPAKLMVYTAEKIAKKEDAAKKKAAKAQAKLEAEKEAFMAEYGSIIETAEYYAQKNSFVADVLQTVLEKNFMSKRQEQALISAFAQTQKRIEADKVSVYVGSVGDKIEKNLTLVWGKSFDGKWGPFYITMYVDSDGAKYTYKGSSPKGVKGESFKASFTVKGHEEYKGSKSTLIARLKMK